MIISGAEYPDEMFPSPNQDPDRNSDDVPLNRASGPVDPAVGLAIGNARLTEGFERSCAQQKQVLLNGVAAEAVAAPALAIMSHLISTQPQLLDSLEGVDSLKGSVHLNMLRAAVSDQAYGFLMCLTDPQQRQSFLVDLPRGLVPLTPGNSAAFLCVIPRHLIDATDGPKNAAAVSVNPLIEAAGFTRELNSFMTNPRQGMFAKMIDARVDETGGLSEPIVEVLSAQPINRERRTTALMIRFSDSIGIVELYHDGENGTFNLGEMKFLAPGVRPPQDFSFDERSPNVIRQELLNELRSRGFWRLQDGEWVRHTKDIFTQALANHYSGIPSIPPFIVETKELFALRKGESLSYLTIETALRDKDDHFIIPSTRSDLSARCSEPMSMFYSLIPIPNSSGGQYLAYRLSHLALPPCGGVEGIVATMMKSPAASLLAEPLTMLLSLDLELPASETKNLTLFEIVPLASSEDSNEVVLNELNAQKEREPVFFLCRHSHGTHLVTINRSSSGLVDIVTDICPLYFFPPSGPATT